MNLIKDIEAHFNEHPDYDELTKIRYIYLHVCKLFSYDMRFYSKNPRIKEEIYNKTIDVTNVTDFEGICFNISSVLIKLLRYFGFEAEIEMEKSDDDFSHAYVITECINNNEKYRLKLDPTKKRDMTRVKLDSPTLGFSDIDDHHDFKDSVVYSDNVIKKSQEPINHDEYYDTITIKELNDVLKKSAQERGLSDSEFFYEKLEYIKCLINVRKGLRKNDDIDYYLSYMIRNLEMNDNPKEPYIRTGLFYKGRDYEDMIWILYIKYRQDAPILFIMQKEDDNYIMRSLSKSEAEQLFEEYYCPEAQYYFEQRVNEMPDNTNTSFKAK